MREIHNKISYLHGLAEGLNLDTTTNEGKILAKILEVLDEMVDAMDDIYHNQLDLENYVETIDEDLTELEDDFYEDIDETEDDLDVDFMEVECPNCQDLVYFESDLLNEDDVVEISCPNCDEVVYRIGDFEDDEEE